jgi:glyoxylase-like metal-dependent hydrolase (beta-lactamase superfamily II)
MGGAIGPKETAGVTAPVASSTLSVNVFTAPGKAMVGERPRPFGEALGFDPITSTLIFGDNDAVLVDAMTTVAEAQALADWIALHNRNLETIYITHAHFDHFYGLSILLDRFPGARAIATPKTVNAMQMSFTPPVEQLARRMFLGKWPLSWLRLSLMSTTRSLSKATNCASSSKVAPIVAIRPLSTFHRSA